MSKIKCYPVKYYPEVYVEVTGAQGIGTHYGGVVRIVSSRTTIDFDPSDVIGKTVACFTRELRKELERYNALIGNDEEFTDAVRAGFCEYMERLFSGRLNR